MENKKEENNLFHYNVSAGIVTNSFENDFTYNYIPKLSNLKQLIGYLNSGLSILPFKLKDGKNHKLLENFDHTNLVFFDIDEGLSLEDAIKIFKNQCIAIYTTRNHKKPKDKTIKKNGEEEKVQVTADRFRVVCAVKEQLNISTLKLILKAAVSQFFHDTQCVDASKGYLTHRNSEIMTFNEDNRLDVKSLLENDSSNSHFKKYIKQLVTAHGEYSTPNALIEDLNIKYGMTLPFFPGSNKGAPNFFINSINSEIENGLISTKSYKSSTIKNGKNASIFEEGTSNGSRSKKKNYHKIRDLNFQYLLSNCMLLQAPKFTNHGELRHILLNLFRFEGGREKALELFKDRPHNERRKGNYYAELIKDIRSKNSPPSYCSNFCSYHTELGGTCNNSGNLITLENESRKRVILLNKDKKYQSIEDGRKKLKLLFEKIKCDNNNDITIIQAQTGLGKTSLIEGIKETEYQQIIVGPTYRQLESVNIGVLYPKSPLFLEKKIRCYTEMGISRLKLLKNPTFINSLNESEKQIARKYISDVEAAKNSKILKITHERFLTDPDIVNETKVISNIWIDEDIIESLLKINSIEIKDLKKYKSFIEEKINETDFWTPYSLQFIDQFLMDENSGEIKTVDKSLVYEIKERDSDLLDSLANTIANQNRWNSVELIDEESNPIQSDILSKHFSINIFKLFNAEYFLVIDKKIHFITKRKLPSNSSITILSASINEDEYRTLFGDRVKYYKIGNIKPRAELIQFNKWSFSKTSIALNSDRKDTLESLIEKSNITGFKLISFKSISEKYKSDVYFYATEGIREYAGKNIVIIGTPFPTIPYLKLRSKVLGFNTNTIRNFNEINNLEVIEFKDYKFQYKVLSSNPQIRKMQLMFTEKHLTQAIGRARIYEHNCKVILFSNFPISDFKQYNTNKVLEISESFINN
ncbi:hypothetical protein LEP1GSC060_3448 [Leptospira weilii serovar Ranarum str. ICFT]|uniref:Uncharacterized protein n=1 Tax=Leptospira weilii serovar Ranarum str. ICFT TaxID=1218598 RepID=N1WCQ1_9LEPT|nr:hypothetical protein [Leptospira weilii]EMY76730.1 hypothetical protein LEP1GSC060_3448 [Leptospira weilii serovar Ranarum str. ICFT]